MSLPPLGWIEDTSNPYDAKFRDSEIAVARPIGMSDSIDYRHLDVPKVQLGNSCVGHAVVAAAALSMAIAGKPIAFPSPLFAYAGGRILEQDPRGLVDDGTRPRLTMTWLRDRGLVAEHRWPELREQINTIPPLDVWQEGDAARLDAFYRIEESDGPSDAVRSALRRGYCPMICMTVDSKYQHIARRIYDGPGGEVLGGHAQVIVGYIAPLDAFIVRNTWSRSWGDEGYGYVAAHVIDTMARDIWVIQAAPKVF